MVILIVLPGHIRYEKCSKSEDALIAALPDTKKGKKRPYKFTQ